MITSGVSKWPHRVPWLPKAYHRLRREPSSIHTLGVSLVKVKAAGKRKLTGIARSWHGDEV
jgi:hypothetical protein